MTTEVMNREVLPMEKIQSYLDAMNLTANLTKAEAKQFIEIAMAYGLNPFKREIYATKYGNNFSIIVGFETYLKRAERSGLLSGWKVETSGDINHQNIADSKLTATITIHRKDWNEPFIHSVYFGEYVQRRSDGQPNKFWKEKPITMIKKVAMAQGFRLCFSDENGGLPYTSEEIGADQMMDTPVVYEADMIESNIVKEQPKIEQKPGRGRPKKVEAPVDITEAKAKVLTSMTLDELKGVWMAFPALHGNGDFKSLVNGRKAEIENTELLKKIDASNDVDEIMSLTESITNEHILKIANSRISQLTETTEANELF